MTKVQREMKKMSVHMECEFALQFSSTETKVAFSNNSDFPVTLFDFVHSFP